MTDRERITDNIRRAVAMIGNSHKQIARDSGLSTQALYSYLNEERLPNAESLLMLCRGLGVSPNELLGWEDTINGPGTKSHRAPAPSGADERTLLR